MKNLSIYLVFALLLGPLVLAQKSYDALVYEGNQIFDNKNYEGAASKYMEAIQQNPKDFAAHYNLGNALYKSGKYAEAQSEFEKAQQLSQTLSDKASALHNLGNSLMKQEKHEKAAEYYKQSLKQDPYNEATRKNYEIAMLKEKEKQQDQNNGNNGGGGGNDQNKGKDGGEGDQKKQQSQSSSGQSQGEGGNNNNGNPNNQNQNQQSKLPKGMEEAILNRVSDKERETAKRILNKNSYSTPESNEKDW